MPLDWTVREEIEAVVERCGGAQLLQQLDVEELVCGEVAARAADEQARVEDLERYARAERDFALGQELENGHVLQYRSAQDAGIQQLEEARLRHARAAREEEQQERMEREAEQQADAAGREDRALASGTAIFVVGYGRGSYESFERKVVGSNVHRIKLRDNLRDNVHRPGEVVTVSLREERWTVFEAEMSDMPEIDRIHDPGYCLIHPRWQHSHETDNCMLCKQAFTAIWANEGTGNSRCHCRSCGRAVCGDCSQSKAVLYRYLHDQKPHNIVWFPIMEQLMPNLQRVCDECYATFPQGPVYRHQPPMQQPGSFPKRHRVAEERRRAEMIHLDRQVLHACAHRDAQLAEMTKTAQNADARRQAKLLEEQYHNNEAEAIRKAAAAKRKDEWATAAQLLVEAKQMELIKTVVEHARPSISAPEPVVVRRLLIECKWNAELAIQMHMETELATQLAQWCERAKPKPVWVPADGKTATAAKLKEAMVRAHSTGSMPLHASVQNQAPLDIVRCLVDRDSSILLTKGVDGKLPMELAMNTGVDARILEHLVAATEALPIATGCVLDTMRCSDGTKTLRGALTAYKQSERIRKENATKMKQAVEKMKAKAEKERHKQQKARARQREKQKVQEGRDARERDARLEKGRQATQKARTAQKAQQNASKTELRPVLGTIGNFVNRSGLDKFKIPVQKWVATKDSDSTKSIELRH